MPRSASSRQRRLVIAANRLPVRRVGEGSRRRWEVSPGGLVSAMTPLLAESGGCWVGTTGEPGRPPSAFSRDGVDLTPVGLSADEVEAFYYGFSNRTLWPLYHDAIRAPEFNRRWWSPFVDVCSRFARTVAEVAGKGDLVWVHDYQLQLVPAMLREIRPDLRIGFFLHIPFPPPELFAWLPWRRQVLEGLLGADVVGFQTASSAKNFSRASRAFTSARGTDAQVEFGGRPVRVGAFPISIDVARFEADAARRDLRARAEEIRERVGRERKIVMGIDRMDYTKGIEYRLRAFNHMLRSGPLSAENCVFIQVAVPSREAVQEYAQMREQIDGMVGRINSERSELGRVAVQYFWRNLPRDELVAHYLAADVMLVTPLRDGMNLVAKEYVATRLSGDGALVLSEFAGAAEELKRATLVNPRDIDGMASAFEEALTADSGESRARMASLRAAVRRHTVFDWADDFLGALRA